jgi:hypothetical protein
METNGVATVFEPAVYRCYALHRKKRRGRRSEVRPDRRLWREAPPALRDGDGRHDPRRLAPQRRPGEGPAEGPLELFATPLSILLGHSRRSKSNNAPRLPAPSGRHLQPLQGVPEAAPAVPVPSEHPFGCEVVRKSSSALLVRRCATCPPPRRVRLCTGTNTNRLDPVLGLRPDKEAQMILTMLRMTIGEAR